MGYGKNAGERVSKAGRMNELKNVRRRGGKQHISQSKLAAEDSL